MSDPADDCRPGGGLPGGARDHLRWILARRRILAGPVLVYEAWFSILALALFLPAAAWLMNRLVLAGGGSAIGNTEMVGFFLSVPGLVFLLVAAVSVIALNYAEYAGLLIIVRACSRGLKGNAGEGVWRSLAHLPVLARLGLIQTLVFGLGMLPWLGGCLWIKMHWLGAHDINFYLSRRPPEWFFALAVAGFWTLPWLFAAVVLLVRWLHAVPLVVFEGKRPIEALAVSWRRSRGMVRSGVLVLALWILGAIGVFVLAGSLIRWAGAALLGSSSVGLGWTLGVVLSALGLMALLGLLVVVVSKVGLVLIVFSAYEAGIPNGTSPATFSLPVWLERLRPTNARLAAWVLLVILLVSAGYAVSEFVEDIHPADAPRITAHRGSSAKAPENSLSALRQAIADGADYAEIDVQTTRDGRVILHHDGDFMRMAGVPGRVEEMTLEEVRDLEIGSLFSEGFAGERVATLEEAIAVCRGRLRLNIELKYNRVDPLLAGRVGAILRAESFTGDCIVMSLNWEPLRAFAGDFPEVPIGYIVFRSLGRIGAAAADAFSLNANQLTPGLVRSLHRSGAEVHVWTVNDSRLALGMIEMGVDNLITDRPGEMRLLVDEWEALTDSEKTALHLRRILLPNVTLAAAPL